MGPIRSSIDICWKLTGKKQGIYFKPISPPSALNDVWRALHGKRIFWAVTLQSGGVESFRPIATSVGQIGKLPTKNGEKQ